MHFPCDKCKRAGAICSGLEGERCGRCRAIRKPCSHNTQPRPSPSKSSPPGAVKFMSSLSFSATEKGLVPLRAKEDRSEALSGQPAGGQITLKLKLGTRVLGKSVAPNGTPPSVYIVHVAEQKKLSRRIFKVALPFKSSTTQNDTLAESQDEDDNAVEELMDSDGRDEENGGAGTVSEIAQGRLVAPGTVDSQESTIAFISRPAIPDHAFTLRDDSTVYCLHDGAHTNTSFAPMVEVTDVNISTGAPTMTIESIDCRDASNEALSQSVEDLEGSNPLSNNCTKGPSKGLCHFGPAERWNPASHTVIHDFPEYRNTPNSGNVVNGPLSDLASDPAPYCSQEVCTRAADGAAVGGGSLSSTSATSSGVSPHVDLQAGCARSAAATLPVPPNEPTSISPSQVAASEGAALAERMSVDDEVVRFMEIALSGMAQVQDGLRGVFAIQKRRRAVQKRKTTIGDK